MGNVNHLKAVFKGHNNTASVTGELWEFTCALMPTLNAPMSDIHTPAGDFDAVTQPTSRTTGNFKADSNFLLEGGLNDIDVCDYLMDSAIVAFYTFIAATGLFKDSQQIDGIDLYPYDSAGRAVALDVGPAKAQLTTISSPSKGQVTTGMSLPMQLSVAVGKLSAADIPKGRGRIYPPPMALTSPNFDEDSGLLTAAGASALGNAAKAFFAGLKLDTANEWIRPCIIGAPWTTAYLIKSVQVGNVPDTQRRRRNQINETYAVQAITY